MFDAVIARKARLAVIIDGVGKQPREDLITSSLFGPLRLLTPLARKLALEALTGQLFDGDVGIHLWPYLRSNEESSEPDVILESTSERGTTYWIVEVKWGASLGNDQAAREIRTIQKGECRRGALPSAPRLVAGYTLLGSERKHVTAMNEVRQTHSKSLTINDFSWVDVAERLRYLMKSLTTDPGLISWARLTADFLSSAPEGSILGEWPDMKTPHDCMWDFDVVEQFALPILPSVSLCHFEFGKKK